jgi:hypothetical protein
MRYIKSQENLTNKFLSSNDWDIIELDISINKALAHEYVDALESKLQHLCFTFDSKEFLKEEVYESFKKTNSVGNYEGNVGAWTISWPMNRDIPCPSKRHANLEKYPELKKYDLEIAVSDFYYDCITQDAYRFGLMIELEKLLTIRSLRQLMVSKHFPGLIVKTHVDGPAKKLHIPLRTNKEAFFTFGDNRERRYNLEVGKVYIINTTVSHGTENFGDTSRYHLLSRIDLDFINQVVSISGQI